MDGGASTLPGVRIRGRSFMAMVLAPEPPLGDWFAGLDRQLGEAAGFFADRPVVVDLAAVGEDLGPEAVSIVLDGLSARALRIVGLEGVAASRLKGTPWSGLATTLQGRDVALEPRPGRPASPACAHPGSLLIDRPVRSGQSIVFEDGDIIVVGSVASGAEVIAGGSVHVYGPLRGRAIAGLRTADARIFCRRLEAEMVGVDQLYRTADHWGAELHGRAVQVACDRGALRLSILD